MNIITSIIISIMTLHVPLKRTFACKEALLRHDISAWHFVRLDLDLNWYQYPELFSRVLKLQKYAFSLITNWKILLSATTPCHAHILLQIKDAPRNFWKALWKDLFETSGHNCSSTESKKQTLCVVGVDAGNAVTPSTGPPTADGVLYILHMGDGTIPTVLNN